MTVPVGCGASDGALALLSAVGDVCARRRIGFGRRRADLAARFARSRGVEETAVVASWIAGALADLGLLRVVLAAEAGERDRALALADAPLHGAHLIVELGLPPAAADIVRWHAEHDDGTGVPDRLRWDGIPPDAAGVGIAQAFLALIEDDAEPRPAGEALVALVGESGRRFAVEHLRAFRAFVAADPAGWDAPLPLAFPPLDDDAVLATLASWIDARDERTRRRSERVATLAAAIAARLALDERRLARLVRLRALGRADRDPAREPIDPLSRFAREQTLREARRAAEIASTVPRYEADAMLVGTSGSWYEDGAVEREAAVVALALAAEAIETPEQSRRIAAAAGTQFDPAVVEAYRSILVSR